MKRVNSSLFTVLSAVLAVSACQREAAVADTQAPVQGEEMVIPVSVEGAISVDGTLSAADTKVTVNSTTGVTAWETNDRIGVYISGTGKNTYVQAAVANNATRLSLSSGESRANYAVYPYSSAYAGGYTSPTVVYPNSYDMYGKGVTSANTWAPTPMVASNANGQDLRFFHVGGLLRLHVTEIPAGTTQLVVTFTGLSNVFGRFTVNNPGTSTATTTYSASGTNAVTFTNLSIVGGEAYLNIPVPTKDFSGLTAITVSATGGTDLTTTKEVSGWGAVGHGTGKKVDVSFISITHGTGYTGKFRGKEIAPGYLVWDADASAYKLSDPDDPFYPIRFYNQASALNVVYHQWGSTAQSLKGRLDGNYNERTDITNGVVLDGLVWSMPSQSQWGVIYGSGTSNNVRINSTNTTGTPFSVIRVDLSGATSVGEEGYNYSSKGLNNASGGAVTANNGGYQVGLLLVPDNTTVTCHGFTAGNRSFTAGTAISWSALKMLLDGGCVFLPAAGDYGGGWHYGGTYGHYWSSSRSGSSNAYYLSFDSASGGSISTSNYEKSYYCPVLLVRE